MSDPPHEAPRAWTAPGTPPFGAPPAPAPPTPGTTPGTPPARGYAPPAGFTVAPASAAPPTPAARSARLGVVALILAAVATLGATAVVAVAASIAGAGAAAGIAAGPAGVDFDWSVLAPVREWVLVAELSFWAGTVLGVWGLVQGIVAIIQGRGRGWGIAAVVVAALGPVVFAVGLQVALTAGLASGV